MGRKPGGVAGTDIEQRSEGSGQGGGQTRPGPIPHLHSKLERSVLEIAENPFSSDHGRFQEEPWGPEMSEMLLSDRAQVSMPLVRRGKRGRWRHANSYGYSG